MTLDTNARSAQLLRDSLSGEFRHQAGKLSRQSSFFLAGNVFVVFAGYLFKMYVSRVLGPEELGLYALGMKTVAFFSLFAVMGLPVAAARFVAVFSGSGEVERVRKLLLSGSLTLLVSGSAASMLLLSLRHQIADRVFHEPALGSYLTIFAVLLVVGPIHSFLGQYLRGHQEVAKRTVVDSLVFFPVKVIITLAFFAAGWRVAGYAAAEVGAILVAIILLALAAWRLTPRSGDAPSSVRALLVDRQVASYAASMAGLAFIGFAASQADVLLLGLFQESDQVGFYSIAITTAAFVPILLLSLNSIFGPIIANLHARNEISLLEELLQTSTKWCLGLTWPLVLVICLFSRELMSLFGPRFEAGAPALAILVLAQLVNVGVGAVGQVLVMSGLQRLEIFTVILTAAVTVPLHLLLIPRWGFMGAAVAAAVGVIGSNLSRLWFAWKWAGVLPYNRHFLKLLVPFATSGASAIVIWSLVRPQLNLWGMLGALVTCYIVFLTTAAVSSLDQNDRIIISAVWARLQASWFILISRS